MDEAVDGIDVGGKHNGKEKKERDRYQGQNKKARKKREESK
jgi:hypothetical protein